MELKLNGMKWELKGFWPWVPLKGTSMEIGNELLGVTEWIPATVPGGVHQDLYRAGLIEDPYRDLNSTHCEWIENRWWVYRASFDRPALESEQIELVFKGLDYEAMISMNGVYLGEHKGMYEPAVFNVTDAIKLRETAELQVVLKHAPDEMGQIGKTSETFTQKSRFNYKWDFSTRLVNTGIWDDVVLRVHQAATIGDVALHTDLSRGEGIIRLSAEAVRRGEPAGTLRWQVEVQSPEEGGASPGLVVDEAVQGSEGAAVIRIPEPAVWYPNGYGSQPLYRLSIRLLDDTGVLDERVMNAGIRSLDYVPNEEAPDDALPYTFVVNGEKIYIQGANLTPLDHLYGNVGPERYEWIVRLAKDCGMNMLRIWGGGIIEKPYLYELCDRHGILIWQEFIQSSSGIDNEPSKKPAFVELLGRTAEKALKSRRNHVSLTVWSGGNELMSEPNRPSTCEDSNLAYLQELVEAHDPQRLFLPTSASGPVQYITAEKGVSHDVHGHWKYQGNPGHYELYGDVDHLFHSEFGVDGISSAKSLRKFLSPAHLKPVSMQDNLVWRHHGEWWDTFDRDTELFGAFADLPAFVQASQWIQSEGLRFILEANRRRAFRNSGSIIWQLNEPWPNASCTNLVDYYMEPKLAYYGVRKAFEGSHASLDYRSLTWRAGETFSAGVFAHFAGGGGMEIEAQVLDTAGQVLEAKSFAASSGAASQTDGSGLRRRGSAEAGRLEFAVPDTRDGLFLIRLLYGPERKDNVYVFSTLEEHPFRPALELSGASLAVEPLTGWEHETGPLTGWEHETGLLTGLEHERAGEAASAIRPVVRRYLVRNEGASAALHIMPEERTDRWWTLADEAGFMLLPGESREVSVACAPRVNDVFSGSLDAGGDGADPQVAFTCLGEK
ncbi:hypothetical protein VE23_21230 [Paenibacillus sp. D9]|uniref:glycoside hydrolase family 2 protein n=1 Tax=Paenibacillus sp. D9 TaxID=665792 RepID=UPI00061EA95B|nr:glycoside hydrolase family 2 TIM barrel-domain containing protein [Paenibacillus sp. D9]KKC49037.1 hypothetical protein VE23_21230 [Paenibacillus sp. D9]